MTDPYKELREAFQSHGGLTLPTKEQLDDYRRLAFARLDSAAPPSRGRSVYIDANRLIDLVALARAALSQSE